MYMVILKMRKIYSKSINYVSSLSSHAFSLNGCTLASTKKLDWVKIVNCSRGPL